MIRAVSLAAIGRAAVSMPFTSHQEAIAAAGALATQIETASETLDDETYIAMRNMGVALSAHLARVASTLPNIRTHVVTGDTSVTMLAHWLYGDVTRADEIVARNQIKNPGLIPVGTRLEVTAS
jgi:prophage DNA circulation protein